MLTNDWLPITEYALRSGVSISTLRRKIKSNTIEYRMEEGRYLLRLQEGALAGFHSDDRVIEGALKIPEAPKAAAPIPSRSEPMPVAMALGVLPQESKGEDTEARLRIRALEARLVGVAKRTDSLLEQVAELKMLVRIFEERLDQRG
jgi:hypothetical protein